ncbi:MAG: glycosyltransferase, partial [Polyangiales bacterium]
MSMSARAASFQEHSDTARLCPAPVVSVVMCAYNHAPYIAQAVRGVAAQRATFPFELIIGEDCSRDDTRAVVLALQREYPEIVRVLAWSTNVGAHRNVRQLIESARGDFVAHCDGDDYFSDPSKLQRQVDVLRARDDVSAVFTNFAVTRLRNGAWTLDPRPAFDATELPKLRGNLRGKAYTGTLRTLTSMYRASVLHAMHTRGLPLEQYPFSDAFMLAEAVCRGSIETIPEVCAVYRVTPDSATRSSPAANLRTIAAVRDFYEHHDQYFPEIAPLDRDVIHGINVAVCRAAYAAGDSDEFQRSYQRLRHLGIASVPRYLTWLHTALM